MSLNRRSFLSELGLAALGAGLLPAQAAARKPNIVYILTDDLGYGDLSCFGQTTLSTPNIDSIAREGTRFTNSYAGCTVCAPSRCALMTGYHTGHARIRGNAKVPLEASDVTVAKVLKSAGYHTGLVGKWGLGNAGSPGIPNLQGFDEFFGYLDQQHAHTYYPDHLWDNTEEQILAKNLGTRKQYSHDLFTQHALDFLERNARSPFFLYLAYTIPHANNELGQDTGNGMEVPDDKPFSDKPWPQQERNFAAMMNRLDLDVGKLMAKLKALGVDGNTLVIFTSDNGPHKEGGHDPTFFKDSGPLRGIKRDLYEGGIRTPMMARWPGKVAAGATSEFATAFWDFLPTAAELAGVKAPAGIDGISIVPTLLGRKQKPHDYLYWEFHERGFAQAVRMGDWKAVRPGPGQPTELYDLGADVGEKNNVAAAQPDVVKRAEALFKSARTDSKDFPVRSGPPAGRKKQ